MLPDKVTVQWDAPRFDGGSPILQYTIMLREEGKKKYRKIGKVDSSHTSFVISNDLEEGMSFYVRVCAENEVGVSETGGELVAPFVIPKRIVEVKNAQDSKAGAAVMPKDDDDEFFMAEEDSDTQKSAPPQQNQLPKEQTEENSSPNVIVDMVAENNAKNLLKTQATLKDEKSTDSTIPGSPQHFAVSQITSDEIALSWHPPNNDGGSKVLNYVIVGRELEKRKFKKMAKTAGDALTVSLKNLEKNFKYVFRIYAENEIGMSEEYAEITEPVVLANSTLTAKVSNNESLIEIEQVTENFQQHCFFT